MAYLARWPIDHPCGGTNEPRDERDELLQKA